MDIAFFLRGFIYAFLAAIMVYGGKAYKKGILAWRIGSVFSILDLVSFFFVSGTFENRVFTFLLLIQCFFFMPILSPLNICSSCGRRMYWHTIYSNKCQYCGKKI